MADFLSAGKQEQALLRPCSRSPTRVRGRLLSNTISDSLRGRASSTRVASSTPTSACQSEAPQRPQRSRPGPSWGTQAVLKAQSNAGSYGFGAQVLLQVVPVQLQQTPAGCRQLRVVMGPPLRTRGPAGGRLRTRSTRHKRRSGPRDREPRLESGRGRHRGSGGEQRSGLAAVGGPLQEV